MGTFNFVLLAITLGLASLAAVGIGLARGSGDERRARLGRWLFTASLSLLGLTAVLAALVHADALAPLGLVSGLLVVGMLWESPQPGVALQDWE